MKVTIERSTLLKALGHVQRVVERRTTIPILSNVLLQAADGKLRIRATDLDLEITEVIDAEVGEEGSTTLPAHTLHDIVRKLPEENKVTLEMSAAEGQIALRSGRSRFALQSLPERDFPQLAVGDMTSSFVVGAKTLKQLLDKTAFAMSTEETRYYLNGVYLHAAENEGAPCLRVVSTDGHRLARVDAPLPEGAAGMPSVIVPRKAAVEVLRLIEDTAIDIGVALSATKIRFTFGDVVLASKLVDGTFPDYGRVIPVMNDKALKVHKAAFVSAVDRVSTISSERGRAVKMSLTQNRLTLSVNNADAGSAMEELDVEYASEDMDVGFNARYLIDVMNQMVGDSAVLKLNDPASPVLINEVEGSGQLYVLMPMRV